MVLRARFALTLAAVAIVTTTWSCGSADSIDSGNADGGVDHDADADGSLGVGDARAADATEVPDGGGKTGACGPAFCAQLPGACGVGVDACGNTHTCGLCKYAAEPVGTTVVSGSPSPVALARGSVFSIAYPGSLAVRGSGRAWSVGPGVSGNVRARFVRLAEASDGTRFIAMLAADDSLLVGHATAGRDAGAFTTETAIARSGYGAALAIGSDNVPVVAFGSLTASATAQGGLSVARRVGTTWTEVPVATTPRPTETIALAMNGTDPYVVWNDIGAGVVTFAHASGSSFVTETVDAAAGRLDADALAIAVDAAGVAHVAYRGQAAHAVTYAVRTPTGWTKTTIPPAGPFSELSADGPVRIGVAPSGAVVVGSLGEALSIATLTGDTWLNQEIVARCENTRSGFDMAFDSTSALAVAHTCTSGSVTFLLGQGAYPAGYVAACARAGAAACDEAAKCPTDAQGKNCINQNGWSACINGPYCANLVALAFCGDATQDPSVIDACETALPAATCNASDGGKPGLLAPSVCPHP